MCSASITEPTLVSCAHVVTAPPSFFLDCSHLVTQTQTSSRFHSRSPAQPVGVKPGLKRPEPGLHITIPPPPFGPCQVVCVFFLSVSSTGVPFPKFCTPDSKGPRTPRARRQSGNPNISRETRKEKTFFSFILTHFFTCRLNS